MRRQLTENSNPVLYRVEPLRPHHAPSASHVLCEAFPTSVLASLGPGFVEELVATYSEVPGGCGFVCQQDEDLVGFVIGTEDATYHRKVLLREKRFALARRVGIQMVVTPHLVPRIARYMWSLLVPSPTVAVQQDETPSGPEDIPPASLVMLAVLPQHRRRGIADQLTTAFLSELARRGIDRVKLSVATDNEAAVSFYLSRGWEISGCFASPERGSAYRLICRTTPPPYSTRQFHAG